MNVMGPARRAIGLICAMGALALGACNDVEPRIDEILFNPAADGAFGGAPWVELHNPDARDDAALRDLALVDAAGRRLALPDVDLPPKARLVIAFAPPGAACVDDLDVADGRGLMCVGDALDLDPDAGGIALQGDTPLDYLAWGPPGATPAGPTYEAARRAGIWPADTLVPTRLARGPGHRIVRAVPGSSVARTPGASDTDTPTDFALWGGPGLLLATPGTVDRSPGAVLAPDRRAAPADPKEWLILWYGAGDDENGIEEDVVGQLHDLERALVGNGAPDAWVVAQIDSATLMAERDPVTGRDRAGTEGNVFRGELRADVEPSTTTFHGLVGDTLNLGERHTDDGAELRAFVDWATDRYPARRVALIVSGHGRNWKGLLSDSSTEQELALGEMADALRGADLDLIGFDTCLMAGVEVAWEMRTVADVMVASQSTEQAQGWPMYDVVRLFQRGQDAEAVARGIVGAFATAHRDGDQGREDTEWTLSAVRLGRTLTQLAAAVDRLALDLGADELTRNPDPYGGLDDHGDRYSAEGETSDNIQTRVGRILARVRHFGAVNAGEGDLIDLWDFADLLDRDAVIPRAYVRAVADLKRAHTATIIAEAHATDATVDRSRGLTIYFPEAQTGAAIPESRATRGQLGDDAVDEAFNDATGVAYDGRTEVKYGPDDDPVCGAEAPNLPKPNAAGFDWVADWHWHAMIHRFHEPVADARCSARLVFQGGEVICSGAGSTDWDGAILPDEYSWDLDATVNSGWDIDYDCDDETDDDLDATGVEITLDTAQPGVRQIVLTVMDDEYLHGHRGPNREIHAETDQDAVEVLIAPLDLELRPPERLGDVVRGRLTVGNPFDEPMFGVVVTVSSDREQVVFDEIVADAEVQLLRGPRGEALPRDGARIFIDVLEPGTEVAVDIFAAIEAEGAVIDIAAEAENVAPGGYAVPVEL